MTAELLDGNLVLGRIKLDLVERITRLGASGRSVGLGTLLVGDDGPSAMYVAMKHEECQEIGIASFSENLPENATQAEIEAVVDRFNANSEISAFLVQLPLPKSINEEQVLLRVESAKDVDGLHPTNLGRLVMGAPGPLPCTPAGIVELLRFYEVPVEGKHVVIIGRGLTIGRPLALLMAMRRPGCNAAVTVVHTGVQDMASITRTADVIVSCAGFPGIVRPDMVKPGAAVVGAGTTFEGKKLLSDLGEGVADVAGWITPRLGGVGPMTRAMLLTNAVLAAEKVQ
jgi:methylenetetrahydrofolate dehydrogenase (NADP+)/methenyltetrahydrofolate cyclohydrolase